MQIVNQFERHNFCLNDLLTKSNRTEIQTYNVEERTFGTPCRIEFPKFENIHGFFGHFSAVDVYCKCPVIKDFQFFQYSVTFTYFLWLDFYPLEEIVAWTWQKPTKLFRESGQVFPLYCVYFQIWFFRKWILPRSATVYPPLDSIRLWKNFS